MVANYNVLLKCKFTNLFGNSNGDLDALITDAREEIIRILNKKYNRNDGNRLKYLRMAIDE